MATTGLVTLLIQLLLAGILIYAVYLFLGMLALPATLKTIVLLIVAVVAIIFLAALFGVKV